MYSQLFPACPLLSVIQLTEKLVVASEVADLIRQFLEPF